MSDTEGGHDYTDMQRVVAAIEDLTRAIEGLQQTAVRVESADTPVDKESDTDDSTDSQATTDTPGSEEDKLDATDVVDHLYEKLSEDVVAEVETDNYEHAGRFGVRVNPSDEIMGTPDYDMLKAALGAGEDDSPVEYHLGFGDDPCYACDEKDGEFWLFIPKDATELIDGGA